MADVSLFVDGQPLGNVSGEPFLIWIESGDYGNGQHSFAAVATDLAGNATTSATVIASFDNIAGFGVKSVEPLQGAVGTFVTIRGAGFVPPLRVFFGRG